MEYPEFYSYVNDLPAGQKTSLRAAMGVPQAITDAIAADAETISMQRAMCGYLAFETDDLVKAAGSQALSQIIRLWLYTPNSDYLATWFNKTIAVSNIFTIADTHIGGTNATILEANITFVDGVSEITITSDTLTWLAAEKVTLSLKNTFEIMGYGTLLFTTGTDDIDIITFV